MPRVRLILAGGLLLAACSRKFDSQALGLVWTPPAGVRLISESAGPPPRATFEGGIAWYAIPGLSTSLDESTLQATLQSVADAARTPLHGKISSAKVGSILIGSVIRYELNGEDARTLAYVIPHLGDTVLLVLTSDASAYGRTSANLEMSLSTLRWK
ncbi:MAG TPA: hypothetical protein VH208_07090 [Myxococcaceae bacterium]|nr:hypothetical protein [Myxococcaceae bacterium]